jgi:hypothetical protein
MKLKELLKENTSLPPFFRIKFNLVGSGLDTSLGLMEKLKNRIKGINTKFRMVDVNFYALSNQVLILITNIPSEYYTTQQGYDNLIIAVSKTLGDLNMETARNPIEYDELAFHSVPDYKCAATSMFIKVAKEDSLINLAENIEVFSNLELHFATNWVGGLLSLFEIKEKVGFDLTLKVKDGAGSGLEKALKIVDTFLSSEGDKWECQEELEKDKSTKPFASE